MGTHYIRLHTIHSSLVRYDDDDDDDRAPAQRDDDPLARSRAPTSFPGIECKRKGRRHIIRSPPSRAVNETESKSASGKGRRRKGHGTQLAKDHGNVEGASDARKKEKKRTRGEIHFFEERRDDDEGDVSLFWCLQKRVL